MQDSWTQRWDERYSKETFAYGEKPNDYLKQQIEMLPAGTILFPAEGEGRNAVFAAVRGWQVSAFDISREGKKKAQLLAAKNHVEIDYQLVILDELTYTYGQFDAIALIYAHFPATIKSAYHRKLNHLLRKGGILIFEAFSKKHLEYIARNEKVGGPKETDMLFSVEEIRADFPDYDIIELTEKEIELNEGEFHSGTGSVIRFTGRKK
ncbi:MAG: class I SAM-dependent methyltransferase [Cytophaga sp.]|uniref:class I SAM-dependent methyltransferase n=1 Tax=Cytophaga sp. TaxID=29535 RepID=UPI003F8104EA